MAGTTTFTSGGLYPKLWVPSAPTLTDYVICHNARIEMETDLYQCDLLDIIFIFYT